MNAEGQPARCHVESVSGPLNADQLGTTLVHEHLRIRSDLVHAQFSHVYDEGRELEAALTQVRAAQDYGVTTICDPTVPGLGRDVRFVQKVVDETGLQVVVGTGLYAFTEIPPRFETRSVDHLAELFVRDIEQGVQGTAVKAAFLKCAMDAPGATPDVEKVIRAVARASVATGAPVMTHSHPASRGGLHQLDLLEDEGVDPRTVLIGHSGDTDDLDYLAELAARGAFLGMDRYGITDPVTTEQRNATVLALARHGLVEQLLLSQDYCCSIEHAGFREAYPNWSMSMLFSDVVPELRRDGLGDADIDTIFRGNVAAWLIGPDARTAALAADRTTP